MNKTQNTYPELFAKCRESTKLPIEIRGDIGVLHRYTNILKVQRRSITY